MEFLMTYGWVLLVILIAVMALAYFGLLKPGDQLPETCFFFPGLGCNDFKVTNDSVVMMVTNGMGINLENVSFTVDGVGPCGGDTSQIADIKDGVSKMFIINCTQLPDPGSAFRKDIRVAYTETNGLDHMKIGSMDTKVEEN